MSKHHHPASLPSRLGLGLGLWLPLLLLAIGSAAQGASFEIQPDRSRVRFEVGHTDYMQPVKGRFQSLSGHIEYDAAGPEALAVEVEIDAASVDTANGYRDEHLRSSFFEADKFPRIHFKATRVLLDEESVEGQLTIKGVSRPVVLKVSAVRDVRNAEGVRVLRCRATGRVNRRDFGIAENAENAQGLAKILGHIQTGLDSFIADEVEVDIFMVAHEQLAPVAQRVAPDTE